MKENLPKVLLQELKSSKLYQICKEYQVQIRYGFWRRISKKYYYNILESQTIANLTPVSNAEKIFIYLRELSKCYIKRTKDSQTISNLEAISNLD